VIGCEFKFILAISATSATILKFKKWKTKTAIEAVFETCLETDKCQLETNFQLPTYQLATIE